MSQTYGLVIRDKINTLLQRGRVPPTAQAVRDFQQALQRDDTLQTGSKPAGQSANRTTGRKNSS
ncbi:MAG: hypothetical protein KDI15_00330 [Thiothrix sp.]|nr:hypothetical protein [Thiothrix sp.]